MEQEGKKNQTEKKKSKHRARSSETGNFHLMVKTKLAALSDVCGRNTEGNYIINKGEYALPSEGHQAVSVLIYPFLIASKHLERSQNHAPQCRSRE